jgi:hypothetical protein
MQFRRSIEGRSLDAVVLGRNRALTGNYIEVELEDSEAAPGELVGVRIVRATEAGTSAVVEQAPSWARA